MSVMLNNFWLVFGYIGIVASAIALFVVVCEIALEKKDKQKKQNKK